MKAVIERHKWSIASLSITAGAPLLILAIRTVEMAHSRESHSWTPLVGGCAVLISVGLGIFAAAKERLSALSLIAILLGLSSELLYLA